MTQHPRPIQPDGRLHGVVIACRRPDGRWLCIRRSAHVAAPLKICFPGGAIEIGESQPSAVVREMKEEIGLDVKPIANVWRWDQPRIDQPEGTLTLWGWTAEMLSTELNPDPNEVAEVLWLTGREVAEHPDALPSNRNFVAAVEKDAL